MSPSLHGGAFPFPKASPTKELDHFTFPDLGPVCMLCEKPAHGVWVLTTKQSVERQHQPKGGGGGKAPLTIKDGARWHFPKRRGGEAAPKKEEEVRHIRRKRRHHHTRRRRTQRSLGWNYHPARKSYARQVFSLSRKRNNVTVVESESIVKNTNSNSLR